MKRETKDTQKRGVGEGKRKCAEGGKESARKHKRRSEGIHRPQQDRERRESSAAQSEALQSAAGPPPAARKR